VICGLSAGFSAVFGTPVAGTLFGIEVLVRGKLMYEALFPAMVASVISYYLTTLLGVHSLLYPLQGMRLLPVSDPLFFGRVILLGVFTGLLALVWIEIVRYATRVDRLFSRQGWITAIIAGLLILNLGIWWSPDLLGLGLPRLDAVLHGYQSGDGLWIGKILTTTLTLTFGGTGGWIMPILFAGGLFGHDISHLIGIDPKLSSSLALSGLLAATTNTPLASSIFAIELFGPDISPFVALVNVISFLISGERSLFEAQRQEGEKVPHRPS